MSLTVLLTCWPNHPIAHASKPNSASKVKSHCELKKLNYFSTFLLVKPFCFIYFFTVNVSFEESDNSTVSVQFGGEFTYSRSNFVRNPNPINYGLEPGDIVFAFFGSVLLAALSFLIILGYCIHPFFLAWALVSFMILEYSCEKAQLWSHLYLNIRHSAILTGSRWNLVSKKQNNHSFINTKFHWFSVQNTAEKLAFNGTCTQN